MLLVFILWLNFKPLESYAIGLYGYYTIKGHAISKTGDTLKNQQIIVATKNKKDTISSDSNGYYNALVYWDMICPSGLVLIPRRWIDNKNNPNWIYFTCNDKTIKYKNDWRSMVDSPPNNANKSLVLDLIF